MGIRFEDCLGSNPLTYVRKLMAGLNYLQPPIPVEEISEYLGLKIEEVSPPKELDTPELHETLTTVPCWLERDEKRIRVYKRAPRKRRRLGIGHENTHFIIPYHVGLNPFCPDADDPALRTNTEREAFLGGAAMLFYPKLFIPDALSFDRIGIKAVEQLADRYDGSVEATANWYARTHPSICAVVVAQIPQAKPTFPPASGIDLPFDGDWKRLRASGPQTLLCQPRRAIPHESYPMEVKYAVASPRFPKWIRPSTRIPQSSLIYQSYLANKLVQGQIPASDLGSSSRFSYDADCLPFGVNGSRSVMVVLSLPDKQINLGLYSPTLGW